MELVAPSRLRDSRVIDEFMHWTLLRIDVTRNTAEDTAMLRRFGLFGPPALISTARKAGWRPTRNWLDSSAPIRFSRICDDGTDEPLQALTGARVATGVPSARFSPP